MVIDIKNLSFSYTKESFIQDISFSVEQGEIFGFLGPSGAGKSTIQKILIGLLPNYQGQVFVNGIDVKKHNNSFYENICIDFEYPSLYEKLTATENLKFFASLYSKNNCKKEFTDKLLSSVGLLYDADKKVSEFSKGMKSRLNFVKALVNEPSILFLDEPTSGLDPSNSRIMKDLILEQSKKGTTVIITTHNMEDAKELCDRVAFIVDGKVRSLDTPHNLIMAKGASRLTYSFLEDGKEKSSSCVLTQISDDKQLTSLIAENRLLTAHTTEPTLGDIFMEVTGRKLQ